MRARGFSLPAAGKTGTSRDGWFAGFTSNLLTVVWVGYDDNRDLGLEGSRSALPIWTEFMKRAHKWSEYRDPKPFVTPAGLARAVVDPATGMLAGPYCPSRTAEVYIDGTQPFTFCTTHTQPELPPAPELKMAGEVLPAGQNITEAADPTPPAGPAMPASAPRADQPSAPALRDHNP